MFDGLAQWLATITWPLVSRVLVALGLGTVTYTGASSALNSALDSAVGSAYQLTGVVFALVAKAGLFDVLAITSGGFVSGIAWLVAKRWAFAAGGAT